MVLGVLCLCVVGEAAASTTTAHIISFLQLFFSAFAAIYLYTIIPFHFVQQLFFVWVVCVTKWKWSTILFRGWASESHLDIKLKTAHSLLLFSSIPIFLPDFFGRRGHFILLLTDSKGPNVCVRNESKEPKTFQLDDWPYSVIDILDESTQFTSRYDVRSINVQRHLDKTAGFIFGRFFDRFSSNNVTDGLFEYHHRTSHKNDSV